MPDSEEIRQLEQNILAEGKLISPLIVWKGILIDGHNRYKILKEHSEVEWMIYEKDFVNRYEAIAWICANQIGRRNLRPSDKRYLIGHQYQAERQTVSFHGNQYTEPTGSGDDKKCQHQNGDVGTARQRIAARVGVSEGYVQKADEYARGIDAAEEAVPGARQELLGGRIKATATQVAEIAKAIPEERSQMVERLLKPIIKPTSFSDDEPEMIRTFDDIGTRIEASLFPRITEENILRTMSGSSDIFIGDCEMNITDFPKLLTEPQYLELVQEIMARPHAYITQRIKEMEAKSGNKSENI